MNLANQLLLLLLYYITSIYINDNGRCTCLICHEIASVFKEYNLKRHYVTKHATKYDLFKDDLRKKKLEELKISFKNQQTQMKKFTN